MNYNEIDMDELNLLFEKHNNTYEILCYLPTTLLRTYEHYPNRIAELYLGKIKIDNIFFLL